jgi:phosphoglycolate phosphatase-like HAD superfamily hydrolase
MAAPQSPSLFLGPLLGIVFDLDGTLVESTHDFAKMRREVIRIAEAHGVMPGQLTIREPIPKLMESAISELSLGGVSEGDQFRFESEVNDAIDRIELEALPRTKALPGAAALLRALTDRGYRLAILTRSSEVFCRAALQRTGLQEFFPNLRTRSSPGPAKPSPEALLLLLKEMGVPVDRAVFIGDHPFDGMCATRAHVRFLGIDSPGPTATDLEDRLKKAGALAVAPNLAGIGSILGLRALRPSAARTNG